MAFLVAATVTGCGLLGAGILKATRAIDTRTQLLGHTKSSMHEAPRNVKVIVKIQQPITIVRRSHAETNYAPPVYMGSGSDLSIHFPIGGDISKVTVTDEIKMTPWPAGLVSNTLHIHPSKHLIWSENTKLVQGDTKYRLSKAQVDYIWVYGERVNQGVFHGEAVSDCHEHLADVMTREEASPMLMAAGIVILLIVLVIFWSSR